MRLLPRSRRGTWLLAGAVWCAACAGWWEVLPDEPRARFDCEEGQFNFHFRADGSRFVCMGREKIDSDRIWFGVRDVPRIGVGYSIRDRRTGAAILKWQPDDGGVYALSRSGDWAVVHTSKSDSRPMVRGLRTGECQPLPWPNLGDQTAIDVTADGELMVLAARRTDGTTTYWWDLHNRKPIGVFEGRDPVALAPDGRWLSWNEQGGDLCIFGRGTSDTVAIVLPEGFFLHEAEFAPDSRYVLLKSPEGCQVYDSATGEPRVSLSNAVAVIAPGTDRLVAVNRNSWNLETWDLKTGKLVSAQALMTNAEVDCLLVVRAEPSTSLLVLYWYSGSPPTGLLTRIPFVYRLLTGAVCEVQVIHGADGSMSKRLRVPVALSNHVSADVQSMLVTTSGSEVLIYDIPPRRSMTWFGAGAAMLALPIAFVAWWHGRKLIA